MLNVLHPRKFCDLSTFRSLEIAFSIFSQLQKLIRIWSHLLKISLMENFIFCAVWRRFLCESVFSKTPHGIHMLFIIAQFTCYSQLLNLHVIHNCSQKTSWQDKTGIQDNKEIEHSSHYRVKSVIDKQSNG